MIAMMLWVLWIATWEMLQDSGINLAEIPTDLAVITGIVAVVALAADGIRIGIAIVRGDRS